MSELKPDLVLVCAADIGLDLGSDNTVTVRLDGRSISSGIHTLAVLYAFRQPAAVQDVVARLNAITVSAQDWMDLMSTIILLRSEDVLVEPGHARPTVSEQIATFDSSTIHISMLNDRQRTDAYLSAIRETIRSGEVVVDLGTGSGVLAIAAAQAGASRVYAIESTGISDVAQANFEANQVADRITLVRGLSSQVTLPERADVLVSEIIGTDPLEEQILEYTRDAVKRFLKPEARLIPFRMRVYALPVTLPDEKRKRYFFTPDMLDSWKAWYNIDFSRLRQITTKNPFPIYFKPHEPRTWHSLSDPVLMEAIDLKMAGGMLDRTVTITAQSAGRLDGVLLYPDVDLTPNIVLARAPAQVSEASSWGTLVWILPEPIEAQAGDRFEIAYQYRQSGRRYSVSVTPEQLPR